MLKNLTEKPKIKKRYLITGILLAISSIVGIILHNDIYSPNINLSKNESAFLYIPTGTSYNGLLEILSSDSLLIDKSSFEWVAKRKNLQSFVNSGRYKLNSKMNNNDLIDLIRSGEQSTLSISFTKFRTKENIAGKICKYIEADSASIVKALNNDSLLHTLGFEKNTIIAAFVPNTYNFYWNTTSEVLIKRMVFEYNKFWNKKRSHRLSEMHLTKVEVSTLASIIEEETNKNDEKNRIAGVYINRIKRKIPLQADPTIKFALGNFMLKRITKVDLKVDSPYNTYKNAGIPPGPICTPSIASIDAVLNYELHFFLYFCAKSDFSGYHSFSRNLREHNRLAKKYHKALNNKKIYR